jgi:hypothetical protein
LSLARVWSAFRCSIAFSFSLFDRSFPPPHSKHAVAGKKAGNINMYDAYGQEEVSGRGASGGKLLADAEDYDFM